MKQYHYVDNREELSDWLEDQLHEINQKVEHIIFRLRYEDPRIWMPEEKRVKENPK